MITAPTYWTLWRVRRTCASMLAQLEAEDNPKYWTRTWKKLLVDNHLHTGILRDWNNKGYDNDPEISQSVMLIKEILEARILEGSLVGNLNPFISMFILKNNYGYKDDPIGSEREDARLAIEIEHHNKRLSDARNRAMLDGPKT